MPIYLVNSPEGDKLVEANTKAQAVNHVTKKLITAKPMTASGVVKLMKDGTTVEDATAPVSDDKQPSLLQSKKEGTPDDQ